MKKEASIEENLLLLAAGAGGIFCILIAAFIWVQSLLFDQQELNSNVMSPVRSSVALLKDTLNETLVRQAKIANARSSQDIQDLGKKNSVEEQVTEAQTRFASIVPKLLASQPSNDSESLEIARAIEGRLVEFLENDKAFVKANYDLRLREEQLAIAIAGVELSLKDFLQTAHAISGKMRFAYGSSIRRINKIVARSGFTVEAKEQIAQNVLLSSSLKNGLVTEILSLASELNRLSAKIGLIRNDDQLNSLIANELTQVVDRLFVNLDDLQDQLQKDGDLLSLTRELKEALASLKSQILNEGNSNSLVSLKRSSLESIKYASKASAELERTSMDLTLSIGKLVNNVDQVNATFDRRLESALDRTRYLLFLLSFLGITAGVSGSVTIRRSVLKLRQTNVRLIQLKDELTQVNSNLEGTVEERTRTIRTILDHVKFGFLLCDEKLVIADGYTRSCQELLSVPEIGGQKLTEVLQLSEKEASEFKMHLSQLFDDTMPETVVFSQVPARFKLRDRILRLEGSAIRDGSGVLKQVLFCLVDISDLEAAEQTNRENRILLAILKNPDQFRRFISDTITGFSLAKEAALTGQSSVVRRELHTIKGNLDCYELTEIAHRIHLIEDHSKITSSDISAVENILKAYLGKHFEILGISYDQSSAEFYWVSSRLVDDISRALKTEEEPSRLRSRLSSLVQNIHMKPAKDLMGPLDELCRNISQRFGKNVVLKLEGEDIRMDPTTMQPIFTLLPTLVRNSIDHGVELPWERGDKPEIATLRIIFQETQSSWSLVIADDGRGIDTDKVYAKAIELGVISEGDQLNHSDICQLILAPNLSTADVVTDISGRGVGMSAVVAAVTKAEGQVTVTSTNGYGTIITLNIPKHAPESAENEPHAA